MSSSPSLPTPRQLLTSILNAVARIPAPEQQQQQRARGQATTASRVNSLQGGNETQPTATTPTNPLRLVDPAHRSLFTTLHVLFPSLLLPALDLLDRGLVTRLILRVDNGPADGGRKQDDDVEMRDSDDGAAKKETTQSPSSSSPVYLVRSAQKPTRRPFGGGGGSGGGGGGDPTATSTQRAYVVHTSAWNCTCAAFAFSAFPPAAGWSSLPLGRTGSTDANGKGKGKGKDKDHAPFGLRAAEEKDGEGDLGRGPAGWQFGGLSYDGDLGGDGEAVPPCCKHLLACVLAERWDATLGRYMVRRTIGREEMAGIFADI